MTIQTNPANQATIVVDNVSKWFGSVVAVNEVSFEVRPGITGLLGPNGAGKSTLIHMMTGLSKPSDGSVTVHGQAARNNPTLYRRLGIMAEHDALYEFYTGREYVNLAAKMLEIDSADMFVDQAIERVDLASVQHRKIQTYSRGMRQRIRLAASMVHDPAVLVLDEPLSGTDPRQRIEIQGLLLELAKQGRTIVVSSHILEEIEAIADNILLVVSGKLAASGDYRAIRAKLNERPYKVMVKCEKPRQMAAALVEIEEVESVSVDQDEMLSVTSTNVETLQRMIPKTAAALELRLYQVEPVDDSLESVFNYIVEG